jgi:hypothetical protein
MELRFRGEIWHWRGPAPHHFVTVPERESGMLAAVGELVTYGWGMIPVEVELGGSIWTTSLWPKGGGYIVPLKLAVRRAERIEIGDRVSLTLRVGV